MGCNSSKEHDESVECRYKRRRLATVRAFDNYFEKEVFMTIAMFRENPQEMYKPVKKFKSHPMYTG